MPHVLRERLSRVSRREAQRAANAPVSLGEATRNTSTTLKPRYRITRYSAPAPQKPAPKDYLKRIAAFQPRPIDARAARELHEENRGDR